MTTDTATPKRVISRRAWIVYRAVCLIFGTTFLAMKIGSNAGMPPFPAAGIRFMEMGSRAGPSEVILENSLPLCFHHPMPMIRQDYHR